MVASPGFLERPETIRWIRISLKSNIVSQFPGLHVSVLTMQHLAQRLDRALLGAQTDHFDSSSVSIGSIHKVL
jgi:hypothetical protein